MLAETKTKFGVPKWALPVTALLILSGLFINVIVRGNLGDIGQDSDDLMRLLQVRSFFQGQSWFDVSQYRLGLEGGTAMHWSRIPDIPLIALIWFFDLFLPYSEAEKWAFSVWPPLLSIGFVLAVWQSLKSIDGTYTRIFGLILLAAIFFRFYRFYPGAIDHHNLQMVMLAMAIGFAVDPLQRFRSYAISGFACAISIAIGMEVYVFVGVMCGYFALNWLVSGEKVKYGTIGFGLGLGVTLAVIYVLTIAPSSYQAVHCDAFSLISLLAGCLGGFGLTALALMTSEKSFTWRLVSLGVLGVACIGLFLGIAPQCLSNPLSELPPSVKLLWLDQIVEAQSTFYRLDDSKAEAAFTVLIQCVAFCVSLWLLKRGENRRIFGLFLALISAAIIMTLYQGRFYAFGFVFAIVPLARWIGLMYEKKKVPGSENSVAYIFALALSLPYFWSFPFIVMKKDNDESVTDLSEQCFAETVYTALNELPAGALLATSNAGGGIIDRTQHRALNGNYHRNVEGIKVSIDIFTSPPNRSGELLSAHNVDYVHVCRTTGETTALIEHSPEGFLAQILQGEVPNYLTPTGPDLEEGSVTIYKVN